MQPDVALFVASTLTVCGSRDQGGQCPNEVKQKAEADEVGSVGSSPRILG